MTNYTIVAFDFDGVLADTCPLVCELLGKPITKEEITDYGMVFRMFGPENFRKGVVMAHEETERLQPLEKDTIRQVRRIMDMPNVVSYVLTANDEEAVPRIRRWLKLHGIDMPVIAVGVGKSADKDKAKWDILIDDHPDLEKHISPGRFTIKYPAAYNDAPKTTTWNSIAAQVAMLANLKAYGGELEL